MHFTERTADCSAWKVPAVLIETADGIDVRCPNHNTLIGRITASGEFECKCRGKDIVVLKTPPSVGKPQQAE